MGQNSLAEGSGLAGMIEVPDFLKPQQVRMPEMGLAAGDIDAQGFSKSGMDMGDMGGMMKNFSLGAQGLTGLAGAYNAYRQMGMMEDQLNFQKSLANRNIGNQAAVQNRLLSDRGDMAAQLTTGAEYGTKEHLAARDRLTTTVDGSPVA